MGREILAAARGGVLVACVVAWVAPAAAEIYRWRDESGREHFTTDVQQVPPRFRKASSQWKPRDGGASTLNVHESVPPPASRVDELRPGETAEKARAEEAKRAAAEKAERACDRNRRTARKLLRQIESKERSVAYLDDEATDVGRSAYSQRRWEIKRDRAQAELDVLQAEYDAFREGKRRKGVAPGCLR